MRRSNFHNIEREEISSNGNKGRSSDIPPALEHVGSPALVSGPHWVPPLQQIWELPPAEKQGLHGSAQAGAQAVEEVNQQSERWG